MNVRLSSPRHAPSGHSSTRRLRVAYAFAAIVVVLAACASSAEAVTTARLTYISAPANASPQLVLAHANGAGARPLGPASTAVLSPDGVYVAAVGPGHGSPATGSTLLLYAVGSKKPVRTLRVSAAQLTILAWAPDDRWIALTDGNSLVAVPLRGQARTLASGPITGASFAPHAPDRLVFAQAAAPQAGAQVNLFRVNMNGGQAVQLTYVGLNQYPLWGPTGIIYSHAASASGSTLQLWQLAAGHAKAITNVTLNAPWNGFEPVALSTDGQHLLANLVGDNASQAWCIDLSMIPAGEHVLGATGTTIGNAISRDGSQVLVTEGTGTLAGDNFSKSTVAVVPWNGGNATTVAQHSAFASWDR